MNYYSKTTGAIYPEALKTVYLAAGSWPHDAEKISAEDEVKVRNAVIMTMPKRTWADVQDEALRALFDSDGVAIRCMKAAVKFPQEWAEYCQNLRLIVNTPAGDPSYKMPTIPEYPAGT